MKESKLNKTQEPGLCLTKEEIYELKKALQEAEAERMRVSNWPEGTEMVECTHMKDGKSAIVYDSPYEARKSQMHCSLCGKDFDMTSHKTEPSSTR